MIVAAPAREDFLRAQDRARVRHARHSGRSLLVLLLLVGPGVLTMLGENDGPSMLSYVTTGATYGTTFFVPFILLTFAMAYVVQEATIRIGIATQRGHAQLIFERFGAAWGYFSLADLTIGNVLTLMSEFIAVRAGAAYFGVPAWMAIAAASAVVAAAFMTRRYFTWERFVLVLAAFNLVFIPVALHTHPNPHALVSALTLGAPVRESLTLGFFTLVLANVGATVTPWMIFFQQSAVVDKGLTRGDLLHARLDTAIGAALAAVVAIAAVIAGTPLLGHHGAIGSLAGGANFAQALRPYIGGPMASLFAIGMIEAGLVAAVTISASSAYATGEVLGRGGSLNRTLSQGALFYATALLSLLAAAAIVLVPHAPLLAMTLGVNVAATVLMAPALIFVLLLVNDRALMGSLANGRAANLAGVAVTAAVSLLGAGYGAVLLAQHVR